MPRTLLLCFIHGFKVGRDRQQRDSTTDRATNTIQGNDNTFHDFPDDLKRSVTKQLPDHRVESIVYPQYETKGELAQATEAFLSWLKEQVMEVRKANVEKPWPPKDREVGVVLVAHSMGGFVAADALFLAINERAASNPSEDDPIFPLIQGILTFDTPYNGLARSMFVYGGFSNYQKVSSVFNVMTALSAAAPASLARLGTRRAATSAVTSSSSSSALGRGNPGWKTWQLIAVRTGTVGAIAAGGVAAYVNREAILSGLKNLNRDSVKEGYQQSIGALGQGLAYINRGNVGQSFAWLSDHFTFVGALLKQKELNRRLERMGALRGVGIHDFYASLGENGYWQGGYFVPERTFCAIPEGDHAASSLFSRQVLQEVDDEVQAHMSMFQPQRHKGYEGMTEDAAELVVRWFHSEEPVVDDAKFRETPPEEAAEDHEVEETLERAISNTEKPDKSDGEDKEQEQEGDDAKKKMEGVEEPAADELPDESPIDIAAAASLVPLPADGEGDLVGDVSTENMTAEEKRSYMQHLFRIAQSTGTGVKGWWPNKMPNMPSMPNMPNMPNMPSMPRVPASVSSLGQVSMSSVNIWRKSTPSQAPADEGKKEEKKEASTVAEEKGETTVAEGDKQDVAKIEGDGNETAKTAAATGQLETAEGEKSK
ncbi:Putative alpha/Beta hydrolase [Colletotrichum destructivum]|uniref:Alpha/Beta hydrolase n=1 Tax=Colletotrichum destructivum TaxID=34406 RepID=A0AAX4IL62_9PEZI|nr:Putative alpha/Beta hydrolase [Colletotrichum destructivum]